MRWTLVAAVLAALAIAPAGAGAVITQKLFALPVHADGADTAPSPLDVREVSFGQRGALLWLTVRAEEAWDAGAVGREDVCIALARRGRALGRLCLGLGGERLRFARARGKSFAPSRVVRSAQLRRSDGRSLTATLEPHELGIGFGALRWSVRTRFDGEGCEAACEDRVPDRGSRSARVSAWGGPRCFGAGAAAHGCNDPALRRAVIPGPGAAQVTPDQPCRPLGGRGYGAITPCEFGATARAGRPRVALIGDSHAAHWRAALDVAAKAAGVRAVSLTSPGCSFSTEVYPAPAPTPARCRRHTQEALTWLRRHRSIDTVVTSSSAGRGLSAGGYQAIWRQVPARVRRIHVLRDIPRVSHSTAGCVGRVKRRGDVSVGACSVARGGAFPADTSAQAAASAGGRVRLHDLSRLFCDSARCFPVIGGAYVYRDPNHMNPVFGSTLGPFLLRSLRLR